jgi:hypothetical protein
MNNKLTQKLKEILLFSKDAEPDWDANDALDKLAEERGELFSARLIKYGKIKHKVLDEPIQGEIADNIIALCHCSSYLIPEISSDSFFNKLSLKKYMANRSITELFKHYRYYVSIFDSSICDSVKEINSKNTKRDEVHYFQNIDNFSECVSLLFYIQLKIDQEEGKSESESLNSLILMLDKKHNKWKDIISKY